MTPFLSFIVFSFTLVCFVIGLINAYRKYKNPNIKLRWVLIPLFFSTIALIISLDMDQNNWNIKNIISEISSQKQDSLSFEYNILSDTIKQRTDGKKNPQKLKGDKKESQSIRDTLIIAKQESEQTNRIISGRIITPEQRSKFINFLKDEPKGNFSIKYIAGDPEALEYSKLISNMLSEAGYSLSGGISNFAGNEAVQGISIVINRNETEPRYAQSIFFAFQSIGINIVAERNKKLVKPLDVLISVGHKK